MEPDPDTDNIFLDVVWKLCTELFVSFKDKGGRPSWLHSPTF